jgi:hypothetical protein
VCLDSAALRHDKLQTKSTGEESHSLGKSKVMFCVGFCHRGQFWGRASHCKPPQPTASGGATATRHRTLAALFRIILPREEGQKVLEYKASSPQGGLTAFPAYQEQRTFLQAQVIANLLRAWKVKVSYLGAGAGYSGRNF